MIQVKEALTYFCELLYDVYGIRVSAEVLRKAKKNDPAVKSKILDIILQIFSRKHSKTIKNLHSLPIGQKKQLFSFFMAFYGAPFSVVYNEKPYYLLDGSSRLLQILLWLCYSKFDLISEFDSGVKSNITKAVQLDISSLGNVGEDFESENLRNSQNLSSKKFQNDQKFLQTLRSLEELKLVAEKKYERVKQLLALRKKKIGMLPISSESESTMEYIRALKNDSKFSKMLEMKEKELKRIDYLIEGLKHRKVICEWMGHTRVEEKQTIPDYGMYKDIDDNEVSERLAGDEVATKLVNLSEVFTRVTATLDSMKTKAAVIKEFTRFWEAASSELQKSQFFKKRIRAIVPSLSGDLESLYPSPEQLEGADDEESGFGGGDGRERVEYEIDTLRVIFDLIESVNFKFESSVNTDLDGVEGGGRDGEGDGRDGFVILGRQVEHMEAVKQKWRRFKRGFKEFLESHDIRMVDPDLEKGIEVEKN